jgi:DNA-binding CsgD family transcriptional regulator
LAHALLFGVRMMLEPSWPAYLTARAVAARSHAELFESALEQALTTLAAPIGMLLCAAAGQDREHAAHAGMRATLMDSYVQCWRQHDPTYRDALAQHAAVLETAVRSQAACAAFSAGFSQGLGASAYLVAPLYGQDAGCAGSLHLWRRPEQPPFTDADRVQATAFAALFSMILTRTSFSAADAPRLAPREHQVAQLAANGRTNRAIASELGVAPETVKQTLKRVFRKVSVGSRTELAAHYARRGLL